MRLRDRGDKKGSEKSKAGVEEIRKRLRR